MRYLCMFPRNLLKSISYMIELKAGLDYTFRRENSQTKK